MTTQPRLNPQSHTDRLTAAADEIRAAYEGASWRNGPTIAASERYSAAKEGLVRAALEGSGS
jgi:hypothetical protein